jgi:hypothetical protein
MSILLGQLVNPAEIFGENVKGDYREFVSVLADAYKQTASGKGRERHGRALAWREQPMMTELRQMQSPIGQLFQARKKLLESIKLAEADPKRAYAEVLGAIVYAAAAGQFYRGDEEATGRKAGE